MLFFETFFQLKPGAQTANVPGFLRARLVPPPGENTAWQEPWTALEKYNAAAVVSLRRKNATDQPIRGGQQVSALITPVKLAVPRSASIPPSKERPSSLVYTSASRSSSVGVPSTAGSRRSLVPHRSISDMRNPSTAKNTRLLKTTDRMHQAVSTITVPEAVPPRKVSTGHGPSVQAQAPSPSVSKRASVPTNGGSDSKPVQRGRLGLRDLFFRRRGR